VEDMPLLVKAILATSTVIKSTQLKATY